MAVTTTHCTISPCPGQWCICFLCAAATHLISPRLSSVGLPALEQVPDQTHQLPSHPTPLLLQPLQLESVSLHSAPSACDAHLCISPSSSLTEHLQHTLFSEPHFISLTWQMFVAHAACMGVAEQCPKTGQTYACNSSYFRGLNPFWEKHGVAISRKNLLISVRVCSRVPLRALKEQNCGGSKAGL